MVLPSKHHSRARSSSTCAGIWVGGCRARKPRPLFITFGLDADLDDAARQALHEMLDWIVALTGISRDEAYALSSFAVDLHVTQTVNNVKGVHAMLDRNILRLA